MLCSFETFDVLSTNRRRNTDQKCRTWQKYLLLSVLFARHARRERQSTYVFASLICAVFFVSFFFQHLNILVSVKAAPKAPTHKHQLCKYCKWRPHCFHFHIKMSPKLTCTFWKYMNSMTCDVHKVAAKCTCFNVVI